MRTQMKERGFSLVEIAIVLVIIGLLITAYLGANEFIQASKQSKFVADIKNLSAAYNAFSTKYDSLPGDSRDATSFFGAANVRNGNGDGFITFGGTGEQYNAFLMLKLSQIYGMTTNTNPAMGSTALSDAGRYLAPCRSMNNCAMSLAVAADMADTSGRPIANSIIISALPVAGSYNIAPFANGAISPENAQSVDLKIDDGNPLTGLLRVYDKTTLCAPGNIHYSECGGTYPIAGITGEENWEDTQRFTLFWILEQD